MQQRGWLADVLGQHPWECEAAQFFCLLRVRSTTQDRWTDADTASQMQMHAGPAVLTSQVWFFSGMQSCRCCSL